MTTLGKQGFDICLQTGATTGIVAGEAEDNGARAVDIHGARAYHQTLRSARTCIRKPYSWSKQSSLVPRLYSSLTKATALSQCFALKRPY